MSAGYGKGGAATPPETPLRKALGSICRYNAPATSHKPVQFTIDGHSFATKGKVAAFMRALMAAGSEGVAHVEVMPWMHNPSDAAMVLRKRGVRIETRKGRPTRWVLQSQVREVLL